MAGQLPDGPPRALTRRYPVNRGVVTATVVAPVAAVVVARTRRLRTLYESGTMSAVASQSSRRRASVTVSREARHAGRAADRVARPTASAKASTIVVASMRK